MARSIESLRADPKFGLDSTWSWVTAAFLSWVLLLAMICHQAMGVLFYGIVDTFGATRQAAAWPVVISGSLVSLAGPAMGYLCRRFSCQSVLIVSSIVMGTSASVCWFANSILFLTIMYGVIHGLAVSGAFVAVNVVAAQHFEKRRTTACSMIFTIVALGTLFIPPLAEYFRATYGVRGTFLLLGGIILNACPAVIIIKSPVWMQRPPITSSDKENLELSAKTEATLPKPDPPMNGPETDITSANTEIASRNPCKESTVRTYIFKCCPQNMLPSRMRSSSSKQASGKVTSQGNTTSVVKQLLTVEFIVDTISFSGIVLGLTTYLMVVVDVATDRGVTPARAVFLLNAFGASDVVLRPLSGIVIDSGILTLETVMLLGYFIQGLALELFVWSSSLSLMLVSSALIGVSNGSRIYLQAPLLVRAFGIESLPLTMGGMAFFIGLVGFTRPLLVGYFRDHHGSYNGLLHILAVMNGVLAVIWAIRLALRKRNEHAVQDKLKKATSSST
ncbi:monocarboxylate transporter 12-like isoform X1 [Haemaphysalis longicornis]